MRLHFVFFLFFTFLSIQLPISLWAVPAPITVDAQTFELDGIHKEVWAKGNVVIVQGPIAITGTEAKYDQGKSVFSIKGPVKMVRKELTITCDQLLANTKTETIVASGHVIFQLEDMKGSAQKANYDIASQSVVITGDPVVRRKTDTLYGTEIIVYLNTQKIVTKGKTKVEFSVETSH